MTHNTNAARLHEKIEDRTALIGIIGLGYVGLPLALAFTEKGFRVLGFDTDPVKVDKLERGECYIKHLDPTRLHRAIGLQSPGAEEGKSQIPNPNSQIPGGVDGKFEIRNSKFEIDPGAGGKSEIPNPKSEIPGGEDGELKTKNSTLKTHVGAAGAELKTKNSTLKTDVGAGGNSKLKTQNSKLLSATSDFSRLSEPDAILICVPTPLGPHKEPDLRYVEASARAIRAALRPGQLIVLESTTYPGTTDDLLKPILESPASAEDIEPTSGHPPGSRDGCPTTTPQDADSPLWGTRPACRAGGLPDQQEDSPHSIAQPPEFPAGEGEQLKTQNSKLKTDAGAVGAELRIKNSELRIDSDSEIPAGAVGAELRIKNSELRIPQLRCGQTFFLAFSPEREDPGNPTFGTTNVPKVVGGVDPVSGDLAQALYDQIVDRTVRVASARIAEASKLTENVFRAVNIALVNELKIIYDRLGIDVWDVLDAAATKPFGFMRFNPGPGLGGHCIPLDPFYLAWRAREAGVPTRFIELAGEINTGMPGYVIAKLQAALNERGKAVKGARVLVLGLAYKPDIDDPRESPAFDIIERLLALGAEVGYHDPHIPTAPSMRSWPDLPPMHSQELTAAALEASDAVILVTDHKAVDYDLVLQHAPLIIDTRGVYRDRDGKVHPA